MKGKELLHPPGGQALPSFSLPQEGLDERGGFAEAMAALIAQLKAWRASLLVTISPYCATWPHYRQLLQLAGASIDFVNWQLYAELESPDATAEEVGCLGNGSEGPMVPSLTLVRPELTCGASPCCRQLPCTSGWLGRWAATAS